MERTDEWTAARHRYMGLETLARVGTGPEPGPAVSTPEEVGTAQAVSA